MHLFIKIKYFSNRTNTACHIFIQTYTTRVHTNIRYTLPFKEIAKFYMQLFSSLTSSFTKLQRNLKKQSIVQYVV